jgi:hypothetical protein
MTSRRHMSCCMLPWAIQSSETRIIRRWEDDCITSVDKACIPLERGVGRNGTSISVSFLLTGVNFYTHQNVLLSLFLFLFLLEPAPPSRRSWSRWADIDHLSGRRLKIGKGVVNTSADGRTGWLVAFFTKHKIFFLLFQCYYRCTKNYIEFSPYSFETLLQLYIFSAWFIKFQFVPHRKHITTALQSPTG